jgi:Zn-dependent peptidase ImmA (M78 family)
MARSRLDLALTDPLDPRALAELMGITVLPLSALHEVSEDAIRLLRTHPSAFSAVTVVRGQRRAIVYNDGHAPVRQTSDIAHELAHVLLRHEPHPGPTPRGARRSEEDEAAWLGAALLVPDEAVDQIAHRRLDEAAAARFYGVSRALLRFRMAFRRRARVPTSPSDPLSTP